MCGSSALKAGQIAVVSGPGGAEVFGLIVSSLVSSVHLVLPIGPLFVCAVKKAFNMRLEFTI